MTTKVVDTGVEKPLDLSTESLPPDILVTRDGHPFRNPTTIERDGAESLSPEAGRILVTRDSHPSHPGR